MVWASEGEAAATAAGGHHGARGEACCVAASSPRLRRHLPSRNRLRRMSARCPPAFTIAVMVKSSVLAGLMSVAQACQCDKYRCSTDDGKEYVYSPDVMLTFEEQWCVGNNTNFLRRGDCRYCSTCSENICECHTTISMTCDMTPVIAAIVCLVFGVILIGLCLYCFVHYWYFHFRTPAYLQKKSKKVAPSDARQAVKTKVPKARAMLWPIFGATSVLLLGGIVWYFRDRIFNTTKPPDSAPAR
eukprot:TRINITY_DN23241_c0_g1_i1.p1 TRINITY_DN23241_c0_g1~~TRINITY_DN23241_c0_g1_i1.p1  ORF type:complete len:285 (+),score=30.27 TRINITY_DN23241_c0_g1_i1:126-857(+)